jgi:two-component system chemotaxis response regulator CheY
MKPGNKITILVVDDSVSTRMEIENVCEKMGNNYDVHQAIDGKSALELTKKLKPNIITMDLMMPDDSGLEIIPVIKSFHSNCEILVVSGLGNKRDNLESLNLGACGFVKKPFTENELQEAISIITESVLA